MKRAIDYSVDFTFNGLVGLGIFFVVQFCFLYFTPTNWYFEYHSIEPITVSSSSLSFHSRLSNYQEGNLHWNDVLRCLDRNGEFSYYSQFDTSADTSIDRPEPYSSIWSYRAPIPSEAKVCRLDSTITRKLKWGIEKTQFIQSTEFEI